ncbi:MAG: HAD family phosphatase [Bacteroidales bacterium]|nr:HAD family phosphatase [Bacteroidales bacterium]
MDLKLVVTDLDGTLLDARGHCPAANRCALERLGELGVVRAVATGRSPYSARLTLPEGFPIDYLIFSSGAGVMRWPEGEVLAAQHLDDSTARGLVGLLSTHGVDFMVHGPIPRNHEFRFRATGSPAPDFVRRLERYAGHASPLLDGEPLGQVSQLVGIIAGDPVRFADIARRVRGASVVRSTSPLDGSSIWIELFALGVSKGSGVGWLCRHLGGIAPQQVLLLGNDYNDLDMLRGMPHAYVVANAPAELLRQFPSVPSNVEAGFAQLVQRVVLGDSMKCVNHKE